MLIYSPPPAASDSKALWEVVDYYWYGWICV